MLLYQSLFLLLALFSCPGLAQEEIAVNDRFRRAVYQSRRFLRTASEWASSTTALAAGIVQKLPDQEALQNMGSAALSKSQDAVSSAIDQVNDASKILIVNNPYVNNEYTNNVYTKTAAVGLGVGVVAYVSAPVVVASALNAVGFTASGVAAGSTAAGIQAGIGNVAAGSLFAASQSTAAVGLSATSSAVTGAVAAAAATTTVAVVGKPINSQIIIAEGAAIPGRIGTSV